MSRALISRRCGPILALALWSNRLIALPPTLTLTPLDAPCYSQITVQEYYPIHHSRLIAISSQPRECD
jgi:hypothetical protein